MLALAVGLGAPRSLGAQVPTRPPTQPVPADTVRPRPQPGDTLRRPATPDTVRAKRDSVTVRLPAGADSARRAGIDSVRGIADTLKTKVRRDSIQSPLARSEAPNTLVVGAPYRWTRDSVLTSGATNLADLLERVSGVTMFRSGWLASAQTATYLGDGTRVRVFRDGLELDALDSRTGGIRDVADIQLANVDELTIERAAGEIRVYIRTWTVRNTTPYTRVDAFTGDEDTNLYRFFYGRRFGSGFDAQVGVQQFGTGSRNRRTGGGGNTLDALARVGWAKKQWSVDAVYNRLDRDRDLTTTFTDQDSVLPGYETRRSESYLRIAYGDPEGTRPWLQAIASTTSQRLSGTGLTTRDTTITNGVVSAIDSSKLADSSASRRQYVIAGGYNLGPVRLSATDRIRAVQGTTYNTPSVRAWFGTSLLSVSAYAERGVVGGYEVDSAFVQTPFRSVTYKTVGDSITDSTVKTKYRNDLGGVSAPPLRTNRLDVTGRLTPLPWLAVIGSVSRESRKFSGIGQDTSFRVANDSTLFPADTVASSFGVTTVRFEAALRLGRMWLSGGVIRKGADTLPPLRVYECVKIVGNPCQRPEGRRDSAATALIVGARGPIYKDVYVDIAGTGWKHGGDPYRPQYQLRSEIGVLTNWIRRFPSGNFGFKFAVIDEYRSRVRFPIAGDDTVGGATVCEAGLCATPSNVLTAQLEIRIQNGTLSYQFRNALNRDYDQVPGIRMPGPINYYGVRWTFWN